MRAIYPRLALLSVCALAPLACNKKSADANAEAGPLPDESDPRVVRDSGDLYAVGHEPKNVAAVAEEQDAATDLLGTGKPDETNGVCRLYAPEFKDPQCCVIPTGFDVEWAKEACGHAFYLGEYQRQSCSYHFLPDEGEPFAWVRVSIPAAADAQTAADEHALFMQGRMRVEDYANKPLPGVEGGSHGEHEGLRWAFLPGFEHPRLVSWRDEFCEEKAMFGLLARMANEAKERPKDAERPLVPKALTE